LRICGSFGSPGLKDGHLHVRVRRVRQLPKPAPISQPSLSRLPACRAAYFLRLQSFRLHGDVRADRGVSARLNHLEKLIMPRGSSALSRTMRRR